MYTFCKLRPVSAKFITLNDEPTFILPMLIMALAIKMDTRKTKSRARTLKVKKVQGPVFFQIGGRMTNVFGQGGKDILKCIVNNSRHV